MDGAEKVKLALDESRILVLGAQVLLGFQLRSVFQERFDDLPGHAKTLDAVSLLLMVLVIGLLIAPAIHHRIIENGDATTRALRAISLLMGVALLPFAVSLGIDIFLALERIAATVWAAVFATAASGLALWFWFGLAWFAVARKGGKPMQHVDEKIPLAKKIDQMLTEARVILPGAQALLGFQLSVVLTEAFEKLAGLSQMSHAMALGLVALATILLMAPAAYHRIVYAGEASQQFHDLGSRFIMAATVALALGLATDVYVVMAKIAGSTSIGLSAAAVSLVVLVGLWHISPLLRSRAQAPTLTAGANRIGPNGTRAGRGF
jgi:uncharacterized protein DUF6328